jgi:hypothetical protein
MNICILCVCREKKKEEKEKKGKKWVIYFLAIECIKKLYYKKL